MRIEFTPLGRDGKEDPGGRPMVPDISGTCQMCATMMVKDDAGQRAAHGQLSSNYGELKSRCCMHSPVVLADIGDDQSLMGTGR